MKSLITTLEDSKEGFKEMLKQKLCLKNCPLSKDEIDKMKKKNSYLWMESQHYKTMSSYLNYKLKKHEAFKELPFEIVKLYEEIETLRNKLGYFFGGHEALKKIIKVKRNPKEKFGHGFKGKKIVHSEEVIVCYFCGKVGHGTHKCKDLP